MDGYITNVQICFGHPNPTKPQHLPHKHHPITYGAGAQYKVNEISTSLPLNKHSIKGVQAIFGSLLYYAQAVDLYYAQSVDNKLLGIISAISSKQASATENTLVTVNQILDYVATHPDNGITYKASTMILAAHSDASYLSESKS